MKNNPQTKTDVYQIVTDRILDLLQKGVVPWQKPWASNGQDCLPRNLVSGKVYRGVNVFLLNAMNYGSPHWLSFKQAQELGGNVRKGEKSTPIVFWKWLEGVDEKTGDKKRIPFLRYYSAFNATQCDGIEFPKAEATGREHNPIETAEKIVASMPKLPPIQHGGNGAAYSPALDRVLMPAPETFQTGEHYYSVLLHELTHATGHQTRLNRKGVAGAEGEWSAFGSTPYAKEELVAEMGAAFLCSHAGIVERTINNSAAYIAGWLERLITQQAVHQIDDSETKDKHESCNLHAGIDRQAKPSLAAIGTARLLPAPTVEERGGVCRCYQWRKVHPLGTG